MYDTFTITVDERRYKVLNTMMNASDMLGQPFEDAIAQQGNTYIKDTLFDEISNKAHMMNMCKDPNCKHKSV